MDKRLEIESIAYEFYQRDGCLHGRDLYHWLEAEKIVHSQKAVVDAAKSSVSGKAITSEPAKKKVVAQGTKTAKEGKTTGKMPVKVISAKTGSRKKAKSL